MRNLITQAYIQLNLISFCNVKVIDINNKYFTVYVLTNTEQANILLSVTDAWNKNIRNK